MEAAAGLLEAQFQKAESDLNYLSRKLELRCQNYAEGDCRKNPMELLQKLKTVKDQYKSLVQEAAEIQKAQAEAMDYFRIQLPIVMQLLQEMQAQTQMQGGEGTRAKIEELQNLLGAELPSAAFQPQSGKLTPVDKMPTSPSNHTSISCVQEADQEKCEDSCDKNEVDNNPVKEDPVVLQAMMRASSKGFVEVSLEEFESVSELVRGRVKLVDVNSTYRTLWKHFKEGNNSALLSVADMHKMGLRVSGATGKAKLKVLRSLKLITISSKEEVKLV
ncbi:hypothetical protein C0Q70_07154 [Pomacea canaliculata]|uniref:Protein FAM33A n=1 Tax=Pomacea canaliculata TaxID=400727 RepID=A0A2T7PE97_POMCA|nr:spindle and kinetochore-associated protein 2-like [Pomacea canaliculata]PVD31736.1 hypothetical protein C0Q70_07154 [Pomacea canaliculata]